MGGKHNQPSKCSMILGTLCHGRTGVFRLNKNGGLATKLWDYGRITTGLDILHSQEVPCSVTTKHAQGRFVKINSANPGFNQQHDSDAASHLQEKRVPAPLFSVKPGMAILMVQKMVPNPALKFRWQNPLEIGVPQDFDNPQRSCRPFFWKRNLKEYMLLFQLIPSVGYSFTWNDLWFAPPFLVHTCSCIVAADPKQKNEKNNM